MIRTNPNVDFKAGGDAAASAVGDQRNLDTARLANLGGDLGVANPDIQSDKDFVSQGQNVQAGALAGRGGSDNIYENINV